MTVKRLRELLAEEKRPEPTLGGGWIIQDGNNPLIHGSPPIYRNATRAVNILYASGELSHDGTKTIWKPKREPLSLEFEATVETFKTRAADNHGMEYDLPLTCCLELPDGNLSMIGTRFKVTIKEIQP